MRDREKFLDQSRVKESAYWEKEGAKAAASYNATIQEREDKLNESKKKVEQAQKELATSQAIKEEVLAEENKQKEVVADALPKNSQAEIPTFRVQIGSFKNGITTPVFKKSYAKFSKLRKIDKYTDPKKNVVYTIGNFNNMADATRLKDQLIREGMKGATVVAFSQNTNQPVKAAPIQIEKKEKEPKPNEQSQGAADENKDKKAPVENLIFKVQIGSFKNGILTPSFKRIQAKISKLTKIEKYTDSKNFVIYTVGSFGLYADATKMKDQMASEGIKDAFVAAFLKGERIKVAEALKLAGGK